MKLLIQPRDGVAPILAAIKKATTRIEVLIFRFDRDDIERALHAAIGRGVQVHALIAHTNHGGAERLRKLEQRLLGAGATVDRTEVSDVQIIQLLKERVQAGVDVRIIGRVGSHGHDRVHQKYTGHRLHVRVIVRDGKRAFIGSQSLRALELDKRREVGVFVKGVAIVKEISATFEADWAQTRLGARRRPAA